MKQNKRAPAGKDESTHLCGETMTSGKKFRQDAFGRDSMGFSHRGNEEWIS